MKKLINLFLFLFLTIVAITAQVSNPNSPLPNDPAVKCGTLRNGLTYYIRHNSKPEKRAEFYLVTNVGAIQESPAQDGLAHFLEHMAFNGLKSMPGKEMLNYLQRIGAVFGDNINAMTGIENTRYYLSNIPVVRQGIIDTALMIMHDYSGFISIDSIEVEKERGVIIEEWRTSSDVNRRATLNTIFTLYKDTKYDGCTLIGSVDNLKSFPPKELRNFYHTWYRPDLQAVIIVGDIDVDAIEKQLIQSFSDIPARENPKPKEIIKIKNNAEPIVSIFTDAELTGTDVTVYYKSERLPREYRNTGIGHINKLTQLLISRMANERLSDISRTPNSPFLNAGLGFNEMYCDMDAMFLTVSTKNGESLKGFSAVMTELERIKRFGFNEDEYERAKKNILKNFEFAKNNRENRLNSQLVNPIVDNFLEGTPFMEPEFEYEVANQFLSLITVKQLNEALTNLDLKNNAVIIYNSVEKEGITHPSEADLVNTMTSVFTAYIEPLKNEFSDEPLLNPDTLKGSPITKIAEGPFNSIEWTLENGIKVIIKKTDFEKNKIHFTLSNDGGLSLIETEDLISIQSVLQTYLSYSGVAGFPAGQLNKMLSGKILNVYPYIDLYEQGVSGNSSVNDFETLLQLAYLFYTEPRFVESEFQPGLDGLKSTTINNMNNPMYKYQIAMSQFLYGNNPRNQLLTDQNIDSIDFKSLEKSYRTMFSNAAGSTVTIVGDVNIASIKPLIEKYIGSFPVQKKAPKWVDRKLEMVPGVDTLIVEAQMATPVTTFYEYMHTNMPYSLEMMIRNEALIQIMNMVYTQKIREDEGGTYVAQSFGILQPEPKNKVLFVVAFTTDPEKVWHLGEIVDVEMRRVAEEGPSQELLDRAKEMMLRTVPEDRITNSYWKKCITNYSKYGIDINTDWEAIINGLTVDSIRDYAKTIVESGNNLKAILNPVK